MKRGRDALAMNRPEDALREAEVALERCPACADGLVLEARALAAVGRHEAAVGAFERALEIAADALDQPEDALGAARSELKIGRPELAERLLTRLLALNRNPRTRGRGLVMLADALQAEGPRELKRAITAYGEAMRDEQARPAAWLGLALALHRSGEQEQARLLAERASGAERAAGDWLPEPEQSARLALWLNAIGDQRAAAEAWQRAASGGPFAEHARAAAAASLGRHERSAP